MVSTGYCPRRVSAPRRIASLPGQRKEEKITHERGMFMANVMNTIT